MRENNYQQGRSLHAEITGCDDIWDQLDDEEKRRWSDSEFKIISAVAGEKLTSSKKAVAHVLNVIKDNSKVREQIGVCTQSFELLTSAAALLFGEPVDEVRNNFIEGSAKFHRRTK